MNIAPVCNFLKLLCLFLGSHGYIPHDSVLSFRTTWCGQLGMASSLPLAHHCQVASVNSLLSSYLRTIPHGQLAAGTTCYGGRDSWMGEWVGRHSAEQQRRLGTPTASSVQSTVAEAAVVGCVKMESLQPPLLFCTLSTCLLSCPPGSPSGLPWWVVPVKSCPCGFVLWHLGSSELAEATWWWWVGSTKFFHSKCVSK